LTELELLQKKLTELQLFKRGKMLKVTKGFTLVELMVVILIVGILAAIAIPLMQVRIDRSKWSEACSTAGTIRTSIRSYAAGTSVATAQGLVGNDLSDAATETALGFIATDLEGTYFTSADYTITAVNGAGIATITATGGSKADSPTGTYVLQENGKWVKQ
jgi:prepilin-type N-terminal cleavage/methylation domain-containing protein